MSGASSDAVRPRPAAIFSPLLDLLCVGGLSVIILVPLLLAGPEELTFVNLGALAWAQILLNMSHFMASYRIVYRDKAMILRHRWATLGVPLLLVLYILLAIRQAQSGPPLLVGLLVLGSSAYLAWHYTGQVWGMMASYAWLEGLKYEPAERWLLRASLRLLLAWHVVWAVHIWFTQTRAPEPAWLEPLYQLVSAGALLAFVLGVAGLVKVRLRSGRWPPARAAVARFAIFVWYAALARWGLAGLFLVQLAHALQYLEFPARVELNRAHRSSAGSAAGHMIVYAVVLLAVSLGVAMVVPGAAMSSVATLLDNQRRSVIPVLVLTFINIHHYFTDGVIWKISNPEVRKELFAHVAGRPAPGVAPVTAPTRAKGRKRKK